MEYLCHVLADAHNSDLDILDQLQKQKRKAVGRTLAVSLELVAHFQNTGNTLLQVLLWKMFI